MAMRLPGGVNTESDFWELLVTGNDGHCRVPWSRYNARSHSSPADLHTVRTEYGYFLREDPARFDAKFFDLPARQASVMDPRQRLLAEVAWECMENAGQTAWSGSGQKIGCYVGVFGNDWLELAMQDTQDFSYNRIASTMEFLPNCISYLFDLTGPSVAYNTACSSSMTALHDACQALYDGDCKAAIVAGANLIFTPMISTSLSDYRAMASDGICKTFDAAADGYGRGEAVTAILIKRLDHAIRDGDPVRAVIRATALNCDGRQEPQGAPKARTQEEVILDAYARAGIEEISRTAFFECHGTGTQKGDLAEVTAIKNVFEKGIMIGSVKPNVGHAEGASAITSLIKATLVLEHKLAPPNIHVKKLNPRIPFQQSGIVVPTEPTALSIERAERVSVNSFGVGGSNAHAILDSWSSVRTCSEDELLVPGGISKQRLLVVSAKDAEALQLRARGIGAYLGNTKQSLHDLAYTLGVRREYLSHRGYLVTKDQFTPDIADFQLSRESCAFSALTFVFTGQGAQWPGMGKQLIAEFPSFREDIFRIDDILQKLEEAPRWKIQGKNWTPPEADIIGLVNLLRRWGLRPDSVVGHSSGEIAAAYAAGAIPIRTAMILSYYRGQVTKLQTLPGAMAAVGIGKSDALRYLADEVVVACDNSPQSTTLSGKPEALDRVLQQISTEHPGTFCRRLRVPIAYHSHHMEKIGLVYERLIKRHLLRNASMVVPMYSTITCDVIASPAELDADYWRRTLESQICFYPAVKSLVSRTTENRVFVEIGPHSTLSTPLLDIFRDCGGSSRLDYIPTLVRNRDQVSSLLATAGELHIRHVPVDLLEVNGGRGKVLTDLPRYPWGHDRRYWHETRMAREWRDRKFAHHPLLGVRTLESSDQEPAWRNRLELKRVRWLLDHQVGNDILFPCVGYIAMAGETMRQIHGQNCYSIKNLSVVLPLALREDEPTEILTSLRPVKLTDSLDSQWFDFSISAYDGEHWRKHCSGQVMAGKEEGMATSTDDVHPFVRHIEPQSWYNVMDKRGLAFGPEFRRLQNITANPMRHEAVATARFDLTVKEEHSMHPVVMDQGLQLLSVASSNGLSRRMPKLGIPVSIDSIYIAPIGEETNFKASFPTTQSGGQLSAGLGGDVIGISNGEVALVMRGAKFLPLDHSPMLNDINIPLCSRLEWKPDIDLLPPNAFLAKSIPRSSAMTLTLKLTLLGIMHLTERVGSYTGTLEVSMQYESWVNKNFTRLLEILQSVFPEVRSWDVGTASVLTKILRDVKKAIASPRPELRPIRSFLISGLDVIENKTPLMDFFIGDAGFKSFYELIANCMDLGYAFSLLGHSNPAQRILEVKSSTCGATAGILSSLYSAEGVRSFKKYTLAAKSSELLVEHNDRFKDVDGFDCAVLDLASSPIDQGFEAASYDLIIIPSDLPADIEPNISLNNLRSLLVPGGSLLIREVTPDVPFVDYAMSLIPGVSIFSHGSQNKNLYSHKYWKKKLCETGYEQPELTSCLFNAYPWSLKQSILAKSPYPEDQKGTVHLLCNSHSHQWTQAITRLLRKEGYAVDFFTFEDLPQATEDVVCLLDLEEPFLQNISKERYDTLLRYISQRRRTLWVTKASQMTCEDPSYGLILGLARTIRYEESIQFATLEVEDLNLTAAGLLVKVYEKFRRQCTQGVSHPECEFAIHKDVVHVGRFHWLAHRDIRPVLDTDDAPRILEVGKLDGRDPVLWRQKSLTRLGEDDVTVDVHYVGLNFRDVMVSSGFIGNEHGMGLEASGIVRQVGPRVKHLQPGDKVHVIGTGLLATRVTTASQFCFPVASDMSLEDAATVPIGYATAIYSLLTVGQLENGQSVLIHSACGAVGQAAIRICQMMNAKIFATVGNEQKVQYLVDNFDIPRSNIFASRDASFVSGVMRETEGKGVDIVLNSLSGALLHESWKCVAKFGKMIEIGKRDFMGHGRLDMETFAANRTFIGVDLLQLLLESPDRFQRLRQSFYRLNRGGHLKPIHPIKVFDACNAHQALAYMQRGTHIGKILVKIAGGDDADSIAMIKPTPRFAPDAAYLLVGGLGGIGRAVSNWMVENGAKTLVILSRSGAKSSSDQAFLEELRFQGCSAIVVGGDVSDINDVRSAIAKSPKPISGVIHLGMVLRSAPLLKSSHEDWVAVQSPKVDGAWNLHHALGTTDLDFFVVFSSIASLCGIIGQASYASANGFLDAFVRYRHSLGLPATTINLGAVGDIGCFSRTPDLLKSAAAFGTRILEEADVLDALQLAIESSKSTPPGVQSESSQVIVGMSSTKPQSDPLARPSWSQDARYRLYENLEHTQYTLQMNLLDEVKQFFSKAKQSPEMFKEERAWELLLNVIRLQLSKHEAEELSLAQIADMGIDSLMMMESIGALRRHLDVELSITDISAAGTFGELVKTLQEIFYKKYCTGER
ncbi:lovastatin nonaketide synthase [Aspergillus udagawae]|nr:lovastatin nonaketide synthase [Aspergillus udagawae]